MLPLRPSFDTVGPITRSVEDAALILAALGGRPSFDLAGAGLRATRFLVLEDPETLPTRDAPQAAFEAALARIAAAGARITRGPVAAVAPTLALFPTVAGGEAYGVWREAIEAKPRRHVRADPRPLPRRRRVSPPPTTSPPCARSTASAPAGARRPPATTRCSCRPPPTCRPNVERLLADPGLYAAENLLALRNPTLANLLGLCALTVPTGIPCCGLMLMARSGDDARLLRLGRAVERALG